MLKYILSILVTALLSFVAGLYTPWWGIVFAAFLVSAAIPQKPAFSFLSGFLGVFLLWEVLAWWIDNKNNGILSQKIASLLGLGGSSVLLIVITSLVGALTYMRRKLISYKIAMLFAGPSFISVFLTRKFLVPAIPQIVFQNEHFLVTKAHFIMVLFAILMTFASYAMISKKPLHGEQIVNPKLISRRFIFMLGAVLGVLTGTVGAGGGFLIIPVLILFAGLEMKTAIGTSLLIIAINSLIGFTGDIATHQIDWVFLSEFTSLAIAGIISGTFISMKVPSQSLKPAFGWFVLLMGCSIIVKEMFLL